MVQAFHGSLSQLQSAFCTQSHDYRSDHMTTRNPETAVPLEGCICVDELNMRGMHVEYMLVRGHSTYKHIQSNRSTYIKRASALCVCVHVHECMCVYMCALSSDTIIVNCLSPARLFLMGSTQLVSLDVCSCIPD